MNSQKLPLVHDKAHFNLFGLALLLVCFLFSMLLVAEEKAQQQPIPLAKTALKIDEGTATKLGLTFETVEIEVEGLKKNYAFLWIADYHIIAEDLSEVEEKSVNVVKNRIGHFLNPNNGKTSLENWLPLIDCLNKSGADAVLFGGDICDFGSLACIRVLKDGMQKLTIPYMYARADHDVRPWWLASQNTEASNELEKSIDGYEPVQVMEFDDLMIVSFNTSTSNVSEEGLNRFKEAYAKRKPIIFVTHVPINSLVDQSLANICMGRDTKRRNLTWGTDTYYKPNAQTKELLDMVCAEASPVKAVLAGHLHFSWHGMLTKSISQHLFHPSFKGNIGVIIVKNKK
ncbi:MAG: metallophosphoesterase [Victivallales bacterium]|nr:metallophosphoesterase [Victivallales bacterium]